MEWSKPFTSELYEVDLYVVKDVWFIARAKYTLPLKMFQLLMDCVINTFNLRTWKKETGGTQGFKSRLIYRVTSRTIRAVKEENPACLEKQNKTNKCSRLHRLLISY